VKIYPIVNYTTLERSTTPNLCCNDTCDFISGLCDDSDPCNPGFCTDTGLCLNQPVICEIDGNLCSTNTCIAGTCIWGCITDLCCDDGNNCTDDVCANGQCYHIQKEFCDCTAFNNCVSCLTAASATSFDLKCAWDPCKLECLNYASLLENGTLYDYRLVNATVYPESSHWSGRGDHIWSNATDLRLFCLPPSGNSGALAGAIVGGVLGGALLLCLLLLLLLLLLMRLKERIRGSGAPAVNNTSGDLCAATNPLYAEQNSFHNPLHGMH